MEQLTVRQHDVFQFIAWYMENQSSAPSYREIADHFGFASPRAASDHVNALIRKGYLLKISGISRGIRLTQAASDLLNEPEGIPVVGDVAAGFPILAEEHIRGHLNLNDTFGGGNLFAVRVRGESMIGCGIMDGDYVIVRRSPVVESGTIAVVYVEGEATCKRLVKTGGGYELRPENPDMSPIPVTDSCTDFQIAGPVIGIVRHMQPHVL